MSTADMSWEFYPDQMIRALAAEGVSQGWKRQLAEILFVLWFVYDTICVGRHGLVWPIGLKFSLPMELNIHFVGRRYGSTNGRETHIILRSFPISMAASGIESIHYLLEKG
jgi:hypothetical protein